MLEIFKIGENRAQNISTLLAEKMYWFEKFRTECWRSRVSGRRLVTSTPRNIVKLSQQATIDEIN